MAIPPAMRRFLVITNWCRTVVDTINDRQQVRSLILPGRGDRRPDAARDLGRQQPDAHLAMFNRDRMIYGRAFMSVGANEDNAELPFVRVESPREMVAEIDRRTEMSRPRPGSTGRPRRRGRRRSPCTCPRDGLGRASGSDGRGPRWTATTTASGVVPVVMHLNRRMSGEWRGESQMTDIIPLVDSAARSLTNLQFAQEAHGIPRMWMTGVAKGDFLDEDGLPDPAVRGVLRRDPHDHRRAGQGRAA
jgi:hypothetical protein